MFIMLEKVDKWCGIVLRHRKLVKFKLKKTNKFWVLVFYKFVGKCARCVFTLGVRRLCESNVLKLEALRYIVVCSAINRIYLFMLRLCHWKLTNKQTTSSRLNLRLRHDRHLGFNLTYEPMINLDVYNDCFRPFKFGITLLTAFRFEDYKITYSNGWYIFFKFSK